MGKPSLMPEFGDYGMVWGRIGEILLLIYGLLFSVYTGWWGYILIAGRYDLIEKWWQVQPQWTRKLVLIRKLPRFVEVLYGVILLIFAIIFFVIFCALFIKTLLQIGG